MSSLNLTLKPAQTELIARPGVTLTQAYTVFNDSDSSVLLSTEVLPWVPTDAEGSLTYSNVPPNPYFEFSLANSDLKLGQTFLLHPRENRQLVLKIRSNASTPLSDGYFTFFVTHNTTNSLSPEENQSSATGKIGSHILLSTSTTEYPVSKASIAKFTASPTFKDIFFPPVRFNAEVFNSSSYFTKTVGKLSVTKNGLVIDEVELYPLNVLSQHSRSIRCNAGNTPVPCTLSPPFWPGAYTATITLDPALSAPSATITFYIFPWSLILTALLTLAITLSIVKLLRSRSKNAH